MATRPAKKAAQKKAATKTATSATKAATKTATPAKEPKKAAAKKAATPTKPAPTAPRPTTARSTTATTARPSPSARPASAMKLTADHAFAHARWREALRLYAPVVAACPLHVRSRLRVGDALLNLGERRLALEVYRTTATLAAQTGAPLAALVAIKIISLLDSDDGDDAVSAVTDYARGSESLDALMAPESPPEPGHEAVTPLDDGPALLETAAALARALPPRLKAAATVPAIPLFSYLDEDDFLQALSCLRLRRFSDGEPIIRQGERSESAFIIADGDVVVTRDADDEGAIIARLRTGAVFGELAFISDEPRQANAIASGDVDLLEMRRSDLVVAAAHLPGLSEALRLFTRERFLKNLTATHPFFGPLRRDDRHRVMELTRVLTFQAGDVLIQEGKRGPGLFVLLGGQAAVKKALPEKPDHPLEHIHLATLRGGDLCGEMSMLTDAPTNATVTCTADMEALFLSRDAFKAVAAEHPELIRYLAGVTDERLRKNRALLHGRSLLEDDEQVMI